MKNSQTVARLTSMVVLVVLFCVLTGLVVSHSINGLENSTYNALARFASPWLTELMTFITNFGSVYAIAAVVLVLLVIPSTRMHYGVPVAFGSIAGALAMSGIKELVARQRPDETIRLVVESGYGFPSGHTTTSTVVFVLILLTVFRQSKKLAVRIPALIVCIMAPLLIGTSRIYLGVHYAGDVLGGLILGVLIALLTDTIFKHFKPFR
jgi:undecaprenyl-diphosphatase